MKKKDGASQNSDSIPTIRFRESIAYDENGEIVSDVLYRAHHENGSGFMLGYMSNIDKLILSTKHPSILRVFFHIACHQQYGNDGIFGYRCSKKYLQDTLDIKRPALWSALNWLKEKFIINEMPSGGVFEFMVNPDFVTIGKEKKKRVSEWNRRCTEYIKKLESK